ncbi:MAG: galactose-1-phosphate uridylyltransferase, partial [Ktedonobacteraceae bacterium]
MEQNTSLIWNPILRQYLVNSPNHMYRQEGSSECPFCEDIDKDRVGPNTQVWLHPNDFPPFQPPVGEAYVVIYNRDHHRTFAQLTVKEVFSVTHLWRDLYVDLASRYATVMIFENSGESIGQTQRHPHGQSFGISEIPPLLEREFETALQSETEGTSCPFCSVRAELSASEYEVVANSTWQAFLPPYVRYPYETHLYPRRHVANLAHVQDNGLHDLAELLLHVVRGYNALYDGAMAPMPYLLGIHQLADSRFHLHVEILAIGRAPGKLKYAASSESLWGLWTNDSSPIQKASEL